MPVNVDGPRQMNDPIPEQHWTISMAEKTCPATCTCALCSRCSDTNAEATPTRTIPRSRPRRHVRRSLPSTSSVMEVLYPLSHLGSPPPFLEPPSYFPRDIHIPAAQRDHREHNGRTTIGREAVVPSSYHDPLTEAPTLTGVPSPGDPSGRISSVEPNTPVVVGLGIDISEEAGPPPAYSRFDDSRSRLPLTLEVLGPYPPISTLNPPSR